MVLRVLTNINFICKRTPYKVGKEKPEKGEIGSLDNIYFEHIEAFFPFENYPFWVAPFEICANIGNLYFEDISVETKDKRKLNSLINVGPKSARDKENEYFDPYLNCKVNTIHIKNIRINDVEPENVTELIKEVNFNSLYPEAPSTGKGEIEKIIYEKA